MNNESPFLNQLREQLGSFEADYDPADWQALEQRMDASTPAPAKGGLLKAGLYGLAGVIIAGSVYTFWPSDNQTDTPQTQHTQLVQDESKGDPSTDQVVTPVTETTDTDQAQDQAPSEARTETAANPNVDVTPAETTAGATAPEAVASANPGTTNDQANQTTANGPEPKPQPKKSLEPHAGFKVSSREFCVGMAVQFTAEEPGTPASFHWDFGDGSTSDEPNPNHTFAEAGDYQVILTVRAELADDAESTYEAPYSIIVHESPRFSIDRPSNDPHRNYYDPSFHFKAQTDDSYTLVWDFGQGQSAQGSIVKHRFRKKGQKTISLTATTAAGCSATKTRNVFVEEDYNLLAPTAFSPNNNDQLNDTWLPVALRSGRYQFELRIFDLQHSQLIFSTNTSSKEWDGRKNGSNTIAQPGERFQWEAKVIEDGKPVPYSGTITVK